VGAATELDTRKLVRPTSIAGANAETALVARAMAAKAPMIEEKRNIFFKASYKMKVVDTSSFDEKGRSL